MSPRASPGSSTNSANMTKRARCSLKSTAVHRGLRHRRPEGLQGTALATKSLTVLTWLRLILSAWIKSPIQTGRREPFSYILASTAPNSPDSSPNTRIGDRRCSAPSHACIWEFRQAAHLRLRKSSATGTHSKRLRENKYSLRLLN
jgi:hypothetical protein